MSKKFAVLKRDWHYVDMGGNITTWKRGRRFSLNSNVFFDHEGNLCLRHWYGYGHHELIEKEYFA